MKNLLTAIYTKISTSQLFSDVGGRFYLDEYQGDNPPVFPYIIYQVVSAPKEKTFTEIYTNVLIQFSIFSSSSSVVEITGLYDSLVTLFDECSMSITGYTLVSFKEENLVTMIEPITTETGESFVRHWAIDFEVVVSKS